MLDDFMNKPEYGKVRKETVDHLLSFTSLTFELSLDYYIEKYGLSVADVNYLIFRHMEDLIERYDIEHSDFKSYISEWELQMKDKEKERRALWD